MTTFTLSLFVLFSLLTRTQTLWAQPVNAPYRFEQVVQEVEKKCDRYECHAPYKMIPLLRYAKPVHYMSLSSENKKILERISRDQAQIWGDTILEGDYEVDGQTRLDQVSAIYRENELQGYLITYSEKAWDTFDCSYDGVRPSTLKGCKEGRIIESSYVSEDFRVYFYTMKTAAQFFPAH